MRVQREIEDKDIVAGPRKGNLRQSALQKLKELGLRCCCIRCREVGLQRRAMLQENEIRMTRMDYVAAGGKEVFLSFESEDRFTLLGFLRLRDPGFPHRPEIKAHRQYSIWKFCYNKRITCLWCFCGYWMHSRNDSYQHKGYGIKLMQEAERIVRMNLA